MSTALVDPATLALYCVSPTCYALRGGEDQDILVATFTDAPLARMMLELLRDEYPYEIYGLRPITEIH